MTYRTWTEEGTYTMDDDDLLKFSVHVPEHLREGLRLYIERGIPTGDFLKCVLENDLFGALSRADLNSRVGLHGLCSWIYNYAPSACHGSPKKVKEWLKTHAERRRGK